MKELGVLLERTIAALGLEISDLQRGKLLQYTDLLLEGTKRQRLVGERSGAALIGKHMFDSLYPLKIWQFPPGALLDLGTGAGLPGIPLKIVLTAQKLYLLDANGRKINFLRLVKAELGLEDVYFLKGRAEEWARDPHCRESYDCVVSRAVARTAVLVELGLPLVRMGGYLLLYKGKRGAVEMEEAAAALHICGGELERSWSYRLPGGETRTLYLIKKLEKTPSSYPRRRGRPLQKPLDSQINFPL